MKLHLLIICFLITNVASTYGRCDCSCHETGHPVYQKKSHSKNVDNDQSMPVEMADREENQMMSEEEPQIIKTVKYTIPSSGNMEPAMPEDLIAQEGIDSDLKNDLDDDIIDTMTRMKEQYTPEELDGLLDSDDDLEFINLGENSPISDSEPMEPMGMGTAKEMGTAAPKTVSPEEPSPQEKLDLAIKKLEEELLAAEQRPPQ